jgi:hypothetical protein
MWKKKHVEAFWEDVNKQRIASQVKGADPHFFGPIVTRFDSAVGIVWLLDGQQRLATATILFSVLRDLGREIAVQTGAHAASEFAGILQAQFICGEDGQYSLELGEIDVLYFKDTVQHDPPQDQKARQLTHRNIKAARMTLREKVLALTGPIQNGMDTIRAIRFLKELKQTVVSDLITARIPVTSQEAAFKIFATLNDRGLRLSPPDLLLSHLMEKAPELERKDIRITWTQMIQKMGTHDIHDFLRAMWVSRYGDLKKDDLFTALKKYIEEHQVNSLVFARQCAEECDDYMALATADESELPKDVFPYVRAVTRELSFKPALPLLLSGYLSLQPSDFEDVAKFTLIFIVRYSIIGNQESSGMEDLLFKLARDIRETVKSADDKLGSHQARNHVKKSLAEVAPDNTATEKSASELVLEVSEAKYMLMRLARYIQDPEKQVSIGDSNLEHIYPQNPDDGSWGGPDNQEKMEPYTWHIGNLTIFGKKANRKSENHEYTAKKPRYQASKVTMTNKIPATYATWDENAILDRARRLAGDVVIVWDFNNPSRV